jgi:hypothetical protein
MRGGGHEAIIDLHNDKKGHADARLRYLLHLASRTCHPFLTGELTIQKGNSMSVCCAYDPGLLVYLEQIEGELPDHDVNGFELALSVALALSGYLSLVFLLR